MTEKPVKTWEDDQFQYLVVLLPDTQKRKIAEMVVEHLLNSNLDVVLADRIRQRMHEAENAVVERELDAEHRRYAPGFGHD